ncbi:MAG: STAS/SEC14 domain-containing protein [Flavobacterium sp.]|uniref:STAS/SEC14 domain-containing protein n=1 Tax=Flavobacterium sp. TaxID=239 RepID=UPI0011F82034|nr:STAS/SEC14 domain-containing protein [Flavobacterium sp.]RZJ66391.1 MAG: STAS/SEC14 domain-containing protein [Flavobacterium sp.]
MIQQITNVPENMVAFRSSGEVTKEDFENVFPQVEALVEKTGKLNYLLELDNSPSDFTAGAWLQDALLGIKNITKWNRAAIVTDSEIVIKFTDAFSKIMPGEFRGFPKEELEHAIDWVSEKTI